MPSSVFAEVGYLFSQTAAVLQKSDNRILKFAIQIELPASHCLKGEMCLFTQPGVELLPSAYLEGGNAKKEKNWMRLLVPFSVFCAALYCTDYQKVTRVKTGILPGGESLL